MSRLALFLFLVLLVGVGCTASPVSVGTPPVLQTETEAAGFVTRLGADTLAVERFTQTASGMEATVALRAPRTTLTSYRLRLTAAGSLVAYEAVTRQPLTGEGLRTQTAAPVGDSLFFGGTETEPEPGHIEGAVRSGLRVSKDVLTYLKQCCKSMARDYQSYWTR